MKYTALRRELWESPFIIEDRGRLKDLESREKCLTLLRDWAEEKAWPYELCEEDNVTLSHMYDVLHEWECCGPIKAILIQPDENSEPLNLIFDKDLYFSNYVKTQFAPIEVHCHIIEMFRKLQPLMKELVVVDEGELWQSDDFDLLAKNWNENIEFINQILEDNPSVQGPTRFENGRILDFVSAKEEEVSTSDVSS
jgi:hypothetical protein